MADAMTEVARVWAALHGDPVILSHSDEPAARVMRLVSERNALRAERDALRAGLSAAFGFVAEALYDHASASWWADDDLQNKLEKHGLLELTVVEEPCASQACECREGDICFRFTPLAESILAALEGRADA